MKRFWTFAFAAIFLLVSVCSPLKAQASSYRIPEAEFTITVHEDGTADVVEYWTVRFEEGSFTRFYKDIVTNAGKEDTVELDQGSLYVKIDGVECSVTEDTNGRPDDTFHLDSSSMGYEIDCYKASQNVTRTYEIGYRIYDAVKYVDNSYYLFTYRVIGANFSKTVDHVKVTVQTPDGAVNELRYASRSDSVQDNGNVTVITASDSNGMYKVKIRMDQVTFTGAVSIDAEDLNNPADGDDGSDILLWIFIGVVFLMFPLVLVGALIYLIARSIRIKKAVSNDPNYIRSIIAGWAGKLDPFEFAYGGSTVHYSKLFSTYFADMIRRGVIVVDADNDHFAEIKERCTGPADSDMCTFVWQNAMDADGRLSKNKLLETIQVQYETFGSFCITLNKRFTEAVIRKLDKKEYGQYKKAWKECFLAAGYAKDTITITRLLQGNMSHYDVFMIMTTGQVVYDNREGYLNDDTVYFYYMLDSSSNRAYDSYHAAHTSSSSGGSSCSSCSSCSGCGGGGAD